MGVSTVDQKPWSLGIEGVWIFCMELRGHILVSFKNVVPIFLYSILCILPSLYLSTLTSHHYTPITRIIIIDKSLPTQESS